jgi:hypothetical protein
MVRAMKCCTVSLLALLMLGCSSLPSSNATQNSGPATQPPPSSSGACQVVSHSELEKLFPVLEGFSRGKPNGETDTGEKVSRTTADYEDRSGGAAVISVELMDSCRNPHMLSQLQEFLTTGPPATAGTAFRSIAVDGYPAYEEWTAESQHTEIHVLVAERFMVKVTGDLLNKGPVLNAAEEIDLPKLAALN